MIFEDHFDSMYFTLGGDVINITLLIFNVIIAVILIYIFTVKLKIHRYNPYRTSPYCTLSLFLTALSFFLIGAQVRFFLPPIVKLWTFGFIWTAIFMNIMLTFHAFVIWRGLFTESILVHSTMVVDVVYLIPIILPDTMNDPFLFFHMILGIAATVVTYIIHLVERYVPSPVHIPEELNAQVELYINTLESNKELETLENLKMSKNKYVQEHAQKTLNLLKENKMPRSNLENNLFLLMLINNNISIGRYRKIFYKKK